MQLFLETNWNIDWKKTGADENKTFFSTIILSRLFRDLELDSKVKWLQNWEESPKADLTKISTQKSQRDQNRILS